MRLAAAKSPVNVEAASATSDVQGLRAPTGQPRTEFVAASDAAENVPSVHEIGEAKVPHLTDAVASGGPRGEVVGEVGEQHSPLSAQRPGERPEDDRLRLRSENARDRPQVDQTQVSGPAPDELHVDAGGPATLVDPTPVESD